MFEIRYYEDTHYQSRRMQYTSFLSTTFRVSTTSKAPVQANDDMQSPKSCNVRGLTGHIIRRVRPWAHRCAIARPLRSEPKILSSSFILIEVLIVRNLSRKEPGMQADFHAILNLRRLFLAFWVWVTTGRLVLYYWTSHARGILGGGFVQCGELVPI